MSNYYGYVGKALYIDLTNNKIEKEPLDKKLIENFVGGSGFGHKLIYDLLKPGIDPLSPDNPIIIATGAMSGSGAMAASKVSFTTKFAIGTVGSGYAGGSLGPMLKWAGYDYVVITGRAERPVYLRIIDGDVDICDAKHLWGRTIKETTSALWDKYGDSGITAIGPAGENQLIFSMAFVDNLATLGRGGIGAVLGSKKLKAIVARGNTRIIPAHPKRFLRATARARKNLLALPYRDDWSKYGIMMAWDMWENIGFTTHSFNELYPKERARELFGKKSFDRVRKKAIACIGCPLPDKVLLEIKEGEYAGLEMTTTHSMGHTMCWAIRADAPTNEAALMAHDYCDEQGLDEWVATGLIDFAMKLYEEGIIDQEDTGGVELKREFSTFLNLTEQMVKREGFGEVLNEGYDGLINRFGEKSRQFAVYIKGLDPFADPRGGALSLGLEQCVNPRGVSAIPVSSPANVPGRKSSSFRRYLSNLGAPEEAIERVCEDPPGVNIGRLVRWVEDFYSVNNSLGVCTRQPIYQCYTGDVLSELYTSLTGIEKSKEELLVCGERAWNALKAVNAREGFERKNDEFCDVFLKTIQTKDGDEFRLHDYYNVRELTEKDIQEMFDDYYDERGWDKEKGNPGREKLEKLGL